MKMKRKSAVQAGGTKADSKAEDPSVSRPTALGISVNVRRVSFSRVSDSRTDNITGTATGETKLTGPTYSSKQKKRSMAPPETVPFRPTCSGRFAADFAELCQEYQIPYVPEVLIFQEQGTATDSSWKRAVDRGTSGEQLSIHKQRGKRLSDGRQISRENLKGSRDCRTSSSDIIAVSFRDFFRPHIKVEQAVLEDERSVRAMHVRNWKVDRVMMEVLCHCWPYMPFLHTLQLVNANLDKDAFCLLASCLPLCPILRSLVLDSNPLTHCPFSCLLGRHKRPWNLSLRFCDIGDEGAEELARGLATSTFTAPSSTTTDTTPIIVEADEGLQTLNLSNNCIGDAGASHLAQALESNNSLLVLNLAFNKVGDVGVARLAQALSWFPLSSQQEVTRRALRPTQKAPPPPPPPKLSVVSLPTTTLSTRSITPETGKRKGSHRVERGSTKTKGSTPSPAVDSSKKKRPVSVEQDPSAAQGGCTEVVDNTRYRPSWYSQQDRPVLFQGLHPLLQGGYVHRGKTWLPGNRTLISLNLSNNGVGRVGLEALLEAVKEQALPTQEAKRGLLRLVIHGNSFPSDCPVARELCERIKRKDPLHCIPLINLRRLWLPPCAMPVFTLL